MQAIAAGKLRRWSALVLGLTATSSAWALDPSQVLILVNKDTGISSQVAQMYQKARAIPESNVLRLSLGVNKDMTPEEYWKTAAPGVKKALEANPEIRCIVTTSGVPYKVQEPEGDPGAAFDSELAAVLREQPGDKKRRQPNPLYMQGGNPFGLTDPRKMQMVFVGRLDGPDLKTITRMVEDAVAVEKTGLAGPVFGDTRGSDEIGGIGVGDVSIRQAIDALAGAGFASTLDMQGASWMKPAGGVGHQAAGAAFYMGWYNYADFQDIFGEQGLARGSIAWHIASAEAVNIWDRKTGQWCVHLMDRGAAITIGPAFEPYLQAFPQGGIFVEGLLSGLSVAESYWLASPNVSWAMVLLGDPMYRPWQTVPKPALLARAYVAEGGNHILEKGKTTPLLVLVECVGPAGSGTPALTAIAEAEMGLAGASGEVSIPALKAGQSAVVRVPTVTAAAFDATGLFRLRLNVEDAGPASRSNEVARTSDVARTIEVEGRIGFSKLTGGLSSKSQMFLSPLGNKLIAGLPGRSMLLDPDTLRVQYMNPPAGFAVASADFAPDGAHIALGVIHPQDKKRGVVISDSKLGATQSLPVGEQFLRWMSKDEILLRTPQGFVRHSLSGAPDFVFPAPEGWSANLSGNVLEGTDIPFYIGADGNLVVKKGADPFRNVLEGVKPARFTAVANDLSAFGAVDTEKRLWVQRGFDAKPEMVAKDVERVVWGPVSRRAVVLDSMNNTRVYDSRDGSWINLGSVSAVQWSPDEEQLLYIEGGYLSRLANRQTERLCSTNRLGTVAGVAVSADGERAFLLAGAAGPLDIWEFALPHKANK